MKYRKKPVIVEAFRYGIDNIPDWFMDKVTTNDIIMRTIPPDISRLKNYGNMYCEINTLDGIMRGNYGDYIIKGVSGEIYPCKSYIFEKIYELVDDSHQDIENLE